MSSGATFSHPKSLTQVIGCDIVAPKGVIGCDKVAPKFKSLYKLSSSSSFHSIAKHQKKKNSCDFSLRFLSCICSHPRRRHHSDRHHYHSLSASDRHHYALSLSLRPPPTLSLSASDRHYYPLSLSLGPVLRRPARLLPRARLDLNRPRSSSRDPSKPLHQEVRESWCVCL